jgi:hypothetical protein
MSDSTEMFDPYWEWLEIPPEDQPPNFYRLLGLDDFEDDLAAIDAAAKKTTAYLHPMAAGPNRESVQQLLSEVAKARRTLLGSDAKQAYDDSLQMRDAPQPGESVPEPPPLFIPPVEHGGLEKPPPVASDSAEEAGNQPAPVRPLRRKSLLNDWRVHVVSASVLFISAVGFVYYNNTRARRVASVAASLPGSRGGNSGKSRRTAPVTARGAGQASANGASNSGRVGQSQVMPDAPRKPKVRPSGQKSSLELLLAQDGLLIESSKGPENAMRRGGRKDGAQQDGSKSDKNPSAGDALPENQSIKLPENWLAGLQVTKDFAAPLDQDFDVSNLKSALTTADGKLVVQPSKPSGKMGSLALKGNELGVGETVVVKTNLNSATPTNVRVGLMVGGLRVHLCPRSEVVEIRINGVKAGEIVGSKDNEITLAVCRDSNDKKQFHWLAQSGKETVSGSGVFASGLGNAAKIGILTKCGENKPKVTVAINEFAYGKLASQVAFSQTKRLTVDVQPK